MKILQVISSFPPAYSYGGPVQSAFELSRALIKKGHKVTVFTTDVYDAKNRLIYADNPIRLENIEIFHFKNFSNILAHKNFAFAPLMAFDLEKYIKTFDIVHVHEFRTFSGLIASYFAKKYNIPLVLQPRGSIPRISKYKLKIFFDRIFGKYIINNACKIIASSHVESNLYWITYPSLPTRKIIHIPNGINFHDYNNLPQRGQFKNKYGIPHEVKIILFMSRIHVRKGADLLLSASAQLLRINKDIKLVVAGPDDGFLLRLKKMAKSLQISDKVLFPGPLYGEEKLKAYVDAHVFVLPSKDQYESFGNVVLEALACGTPVIMTNNCGVSEWITDEMGKVIEYDEHQLIEALNHFLKYPHFIDEIENKLNIFNWDTLIHDYESLYYQCV